MTINEAMATAMSHQTAGRLAEAEAVYRSVLSVEPKHAFANYNLGLIALSVGRADVAVDLIRTAVAGRSDIAGFHNTLGEALRLAGQPAEAIAAYDRAIARAPSEPIPHNNRGLALESLARSPEAEAAFRQALALNPRYTDAWANLGATLTGGGRHDEAVKALQTAVETAPSNVEARLALGRTLIGAGRPAEAAEAADGARAFQAQPGFPVIRYAMLYIDSGRPEAAAEVLRAALDRDPEDFSGARMMLAAIAGGQALPTRASDAHMNAHYAARALVWDKVPGYRGAQLVADALKPGLQPQSDILDAGCGTGLVGGLLAGCGRLTGVDLSAAMIAQASAKGIYAELHQGDLIAFLQARPSAFDAIACAATLIHFGDLEAPFKAAAAALKPGGAFAMTLFPLDADPDGFAVNPNLALAQHGIFAHGRRYIAEAAERCGFQATVIRDEEHERNEGQATMGLLIVLKKAL